MCHPIPAATDAIHSPRSRRSQFPVQCPAASCASSSWPAPEARAGHLLQAPHLRHAGRAQQWRRELQQPAHLSNETISLRKHITEWNLRLSIRFSIFAGNIGPGFGAACCALLQVQRITSHIDIWQQASLSVIKRAACNRPARCVPVSNSQARGPHSQCAFLLKDGADLRSILAFFWLH